MFGYVTKEAGLEALLHQHVGWTGTLALVGTPFFSGFYSKDIIIEATKHAAEGGGMVHQYAKWLVLAGVFVTSLYSFRLLYLAFFGKERFVVDGGQHGHGDGHVHGDGHGDGHDDHGHHTAGHLAHPPRESPWVVTLPLVLLAVPSVAIGFLTVQPMLFGGFFDGAIFVKPEHDMVARVGGEDVTLTVLIGPNGDAHTFEPAPVHARSLAAADTPQPQQRPYTSDTGLSKPLKPYAAGHAASARGSAGVRVNRGGKLSLEGGGQ